MPRKKATGEHDVGGRERLLAAAVGLFAVKGYAATTVRDILRAAGVTAPVLYYHFGNKEGLFLALVREGVEKVDAARLEAFKETASVVERIRRYCLANVAVRREFADLAWVVEAILSGPPEAAPPFDFRAIVTRMLRQLQDLVEEGVASGELRPCDPRHAVMVLIGFMEAASRPRLFEMAGLRADDLVEGMLSMVLDGLAGRVTQSLA
ncbi:MAG TPA: TetR/AcrR family transcriptional regulator [Thermoanaerobaculaceae bacterium]|nr:TetR/AcrR family transcriptional regulator [Thermoanaerobaculaceae bacterium]HPS78222.1 TetR/AcrR family transcriptional regulator [Thermoanaerobaculaceae bacterium]